MDLIGSPFRSSLSVSSSSGCSSMSDGTPKPSEYRVGIIAPHVFDTGFGDDDREEKKYTDHSIENIMSSRSRSTSQVFTVVSSRLSLCCSKTQKYEVNIDEVARRIHYPECLSISTLSQILRRAKCKDSGSKLRKLLEDKGLSVPPGQRTTTISLFTSLVEGEALHLANDYSNLCKLFPHKELAESVASVNTIDVQQRIEMIKGANVLLSELQAMVDIVGGPTNFRPDDPSNPYPGLTNFSLISHGFGNPSISAVISLIKTYFEELISVYEGINHHSQSSFPANMSAYCSGGVPTPNHHGINGPKCFPQNDTHPGILTSHHGNTVFKEEPKDL